MRETGTGIDRKGAEFAASLSGPQLSGTEGDLWAPLGQTRARGDVLVYWEDGQWKGWSWDQWRERALEIAAGLRRNGVSPGDRVACLLTNSPGTYAGVLGVWMAGGVVVSLPLPARGASLTGYAATLTRIWEACAPIALAAESKYVEMLSSIDGAPRVLDLSRLDGDRGESSLPGLDDVIFIQYSSGTTGVPKGCELTGRAIATQLQSLATALDVDPEKDVGTVWLPMSHDMGLFGCLLLTYWTGHRVHIGTPERFIGNPTTWMRDCAAFGATLSVGPNFALELVARVSASQPPRGFRLRGLVVGSERVEASTLRRVTDALGPCLPLEAISPAYGMAEAVLGVTLGDLDRPPMTISVDGRALASGDVIPADDGVEIVCAGTPVAGTTVKVAGGGSVGEILVSSSSLARGYASDLGLTERRFTAEGFRTGDQGYVTSDGLYPIGRLDDLLTVGGRNVWARDIEAACVQIDGVRRGAIAIVERDSKGGGRDLVAVAEPRGGGDRRVMADLIARAAMETCGVRLRECVFVPEGEFPRTPSGKVQRFRCREIAAAKEGVARLLV